MVTLWSFELPHPLVFGGRQVLCEVAAVGMAADVYSFGVILWRVATRLLPWEGKALAQVLMSACRRAHRRVEVCSDTPFMWLWYCRKSCRRDRSNGHRLRLTLAHTCLHTSPFTCLHTCPCICLYACLYLYTHV